MYLTPLILIEGNLVKRGLERYLSRYQSLESHGVINHEVFTLWVMFLYWVIMFLFCISMWRSRDREALLLTCSPTSYSFFSRLTCHHLAT